MITLKISILAVTPQKTVTVATGTTVADAFRLAEIDLDSSKAYQFKLDGAVVDLNTPIHGGSLLVGAVQIKGN